MIERLSVNDVDAVNALVKNPDIYSDVTDDASGKMEDFDASYLLENPSIYMLGRHNGKGILGMMIFGALNGITYHTHICMGASCRGKDAVGCAQDSIAWMFENTKCRKLVAFVPGHRKTVKMIARAIGFEREGVLKNSFLKDGELMDEVIYGIEKEGGE